MGQEDRGQEYRGKEDEKGGILLAWRTLLPRWVSNMQIMTRGCAGGMTVFETVGPGSIPGRVTRLGGARSERPHGSCVHH